jgi:membrane protein YdbS with pleckstrin-like domain
LKHKDLAPSRKLLTVYFIEWTAAFAVVYIVPALLLILLDEFNWFIFFSVAFIPTFAFVAAYLPSYVKSMGMHLGENDFKKREGVFAKHEVIVPYEKISSIHVIQGILEKRYGLGEIRIHTMGMEEEPHEISIKGIENFEEVKDEIMDKMKEKEGMPTKSKKTSEELLEEIYEELIDIKGELARG